MDGGFQIWLTLTGGVLIGAGLSCFAISELAAIAHQLGRVADALRDIRDELRKKQ